MNKLDLTLFNFFGITNLLFVILVCTKFILLIKEKKKKKKKKKVHLNL